MRIFIIGYMGAGKTTIGKKLANKLKLAFIDLDEYIEGETGMTVSEIFNTSGEDYFRLKEKEALNKIIQVDNFVLSTGGGAACFYNNMQVMNKNGVTIYLKAKTAVLRHRIKHSKINRPLLENKTDEELTSYIDKQLSEREVFYLQAKHVVDVIDVKIDELLNIITYDSK